MKTRKQILFFALSFLFLQNTNAQFMILKGTGIFDNGNDSPFIILDFGVEVKIKGQLTGQLSVGASALYYDSAVREKLIVTPQLRYYFKKDAWMKSPYIGLVFQQNIGNVDEFDDYGKVDFKYTTFTKYGAGVILGTHIKIYKRFGIDLHMGVLREKGDLTIKVIESSTLHTMPKNYTYIEYGAVNNRFFAGFNFYFAIGKIQTPTKKIIKNTEGSF